MATAPVEKSVCKTRASSKTGTIEWQIDAWSALPDVHVDTDGDQERDEASADGPAPILPQSFHPST